MPTPRPRRAKPATASTPLTLALGRHLEWLLMRNYSAYTVRGRRGHLSFFVRWAEGRGVVSPDEVTRAMLESYRRHLYHYRSGDGRPLSFRTQRHRLEPLRSWFRWLARERVIELNPASELELPKLDYRLPRCVLTVEEAERVLAQPEVGDLFGLRDRAMLETFYSTGMRRLELRRLKLWDLDSERGTVMIRQGKGAKDRMAPIGERALAWIGRYLETTRPRLAVEPDEGVLFLSATGDDLSESYLSGLVAGYVDKAALGKRGGCHLFRHTCATLMLEGGADVRYIQALLGHADLKSTQIYTHVSARQLKAVHDASHPGAKLRRAEEPKP
jgi:integrase/recombinase XerD